MIVETIIGWLFSVVTSSLSLLPSIGSSLSAVPKWSLTFLKYVGVVNGYAPVTELGQAFLVMLTVFLVVNVTRLIFVAYNLITKIIP